MWCPGWDFESGPNFAIVVALNVKRKPAMAKRSNWDGEPDRLEPIRFGLLFVFVAALVGLIWWAYASGHIKHVDTVPPPVTAPAQQQAP